MKFFVEYYENFDGYDREPDPEDSWDKGRTRMDSGVSGVSKARPDTYNWVKFDVPCEPNIPKEVYVVSVQYTTGSTFGSRSGNLKVLNVHTDLDAAKAEHNMVQNGTHPERYTWEDYFGGLDSCEISTYKVD